MKKLIFSCALALTAAVSLSSCAKDSCFECKSIVNTIELCGGKVTSTTLGISTSIDIPNGMSNTEYRTSLEKAGYNCKNK